MKPSESNTLGTETPSSEFQPTSLTERFKLLLYSYVYIPVKILSTDWRAYFGAIVVLVFVIMGTVGPMMIPKPDPTGPRLIGPFQSTQYPLGTDGLGQGLLSQIVWATPTMLKMIIGGGVTATVLATIVGTYTGYKGGYVDRILTNIVDIFIAIPGFALIIVVAMIFQPKNPYLVGVILSINAWAGLARMVRAETLGLRESNYVEASRIMDVATPYIILKDIIPNIMPYVLIQFVNMARRIIFSSVGLYFLGVLPSSDYNWGVMMDTAYRTNALTSMRIVHWLLVPMFVIIILTTGLTLLSQSFDEIFNPQTRIRMSDRTESHDGARTDVKKDAVQPSEKKHIEEIQ